MEIVTGVIVGLIVAAILAVVRWLSVEHNRTRLRHAVCRHDWQPLSVWNEGDTTIIYVTPYSDICRKCGARR